MSLELKNGEFFFLHVNGKFFISNFFVVLFLVLFISRMWRNIYSTVISYTTTYFKISGFMAFSKEKIAPKTHKRTLSGLKYRTFMIMIRSLL